MLCARELQARFTVAQYWLASNQVDGVFMHPCVRHDKVNAYENERQNPRGARSQGR
nr:hypothetical protein [Pseudomonas sp.]